MNYVSFVVGGKEYKLRLSTRAVVALEKQIGMNPLAIFATGDKLPQFTTMLAILHASMTQLNHGVSMNDIYDIWDEYIAEGHTPTDFVLTIMDIYSVSGLINLPKNEEEEVKN